MAGTTDTARRCPVAAFSRSCDEGPAGGAQVQVNHAVIGPVPTRVFRSCYKSLACSPRLHFSLSTTPSPNLPIRFANEKRNML